MELVKFILLINIIFLHLSKIYGLLCHCNSCKSTNKTCETNGLCFTSFDRNSNKIDSVGCWKPKDNYSFIHPIINNFNTTYCETNWCNNGDFTSEYSIICFDKPSTGKLYRCCYTDYCKFNFKYFDFSDEGNFNIIFTLFKNVFEKFYLDKNLVFYLLLVVCIITLAIFVLIIFLKRKKLNKYNFDVESSLSSSNPLLNSNQTLKDLIDLTSGSGSGLPLLVQRSIARQLQLIKVIGRGRFGEVWKAKWRGELVAVKSFFSSNESSWSKEVSIYQTVMLRHDNILGFIAADNKDNGITTQLFIITNYYEKGSLFDYLSVNTLTVPELIKMAYSIANGLTHLHMDIVGTNGKPAIAHRDLKSKNILIKNDGSCVIADLGLAIKNDSEEFQQNDNSCFGTKRYLAPEVLDGTINLDQFDSFKKVDMYALGLVIWEIVSRTNFMLGYNCLEYRLPYSDIVTSDPTSEVMRKIVAVDKIRPTILNSWNLDDKLKVFINLMTECWYANPAARLTALRVKKTIANLDDNLREQ